MNARNEFIEHTYRANSPVKCATIHLMDISTYKIVRVINLFEYCSPDDWYTFLNDLDFNYDNGYGGQTLFGTIWYGNDTWSTRSEFDGSEWWEHHKCPSISFYSVNDIDLSGEPGEPDEFTHWDGDETDKISY